MESFISELQNQKKPATHTVTGFFYPDFAVLEARKIQASFCSELRKALLAKGPHSACGQLNTHKTLALFPPDSLGLKIWVLFLLRLNV
tara:strand:+ start:90 stop:353 length:264 start_codon:yes stop_codon:yes gene_type:complete